jgi:hypothetical protein
MRVTHEESNHDDSLCFSFVFSYIRVVVVVVVSFYISLYLCFSFVRSAVFLFARAYRQTRERDSGITSCHYKFIPCVRFSARSTPTTGAPPLIPK